VAPEQIAILPNRFANKFTPPTDRTSAREKFELGTAPALLTVSRLSSQQRHKGHERVLAALPALLKRWPDAVYLIAGDGDDRPRLERLAASNGVDANVRFLGRVPSEELPALYGAVDLYVMPSTGDGFGIAFVEAMACGTPAHGLAVGGAIDALCPGELGFASTPDAFELDLPVIVEQALAMTDTARMALAKAANAKFGQSTFDDTVARIFDPLLAGAKAVA
jgi:phosphatidylinositol alpha-1,6-mannosyltransferase